MNLSGLTKNTEHLARLGFIVALVLIALGNFASTSSITTAANTSIQSMITAIGGIVDWVALIILFIVFGYFMKDKGFFGGK